MTPLSQAQRLVSEWNGPQSELVAAIAEALETERDETFNEAWETVRAMRDDSMPGAKFRRELLEQAMDALLARARAAKERQP